jgi:hypothetical protein
MTTLAAMIGLVLIPLSAGDSGQRTLHISLRLDPEVYRSTSYSEPPQMALWIEEQSGGDRHTLWITRRMAENRWEGKLYCPLALPIWEGRFGTRWPVFHGRRKLPDGISAATPRDGIKLEYALPREGSWVFYLEVNLAGDYNPAYPYRGKDRAPDMEGNGQPSLLYEAALPDRPGPLVLKLVGRSEPWIRGGGLNRELGSIDSAARIIKEVHLEIH